MHSAAKAGILALWWASAIYPQTPTPEPVRTSITVVENVTTESPANITEVSARDLAQTPGVNIDDRLREVPGFSLFRRTSSVVANPTTQGVSLRGIGSSGASRSLVLWDGVPMNDPFGGWVYWTRFPPEDLRRVEISRGASTSVFGDLALGGAIGLFSREPDRLHFYGGYEAGNESSNDIWAGASDLWNTFALSASARAYRTDGYFVVPGGVRGAIDRRANVEFVTGDFRFDTFTGSHRFFAELNILGEDRANGTSLTQNSTGLGTASLHYVKEFSQNEVSFLGFRTQEQYHSTYSAIGANRATERLTARQTVPANGNGADLLWNHHSGIWNLTTGGDVNQDRGFSTDAVFPTGRRFGGGTLLQHGEFAQGNISWRQARFFAGLRHQFTGQGNQFLNPSAGFVYGQNRWKARGSAYRAFRSPTLNELYREFRVGNTATQANNGLRPETLLGAEIGADYLTENGVIRITAFRNALAHLITNVTLLSTPAQIIRQRQNGADSTSRGIEFSAMHRWRKWRAEAGYLFVDSRYATGPRVPQIPKHQGSAQLSYDRGRTLVSAGIRAYGLQYEDDLNQFRLPGFASLQLLARQSLSKQISLSIA
ncbi:MAG: TonB-dependent receptor, partial [Acidobacteriota bacterium]|nr:TonB-dependent receptor [Acidobacteriota bacterium]